MSNKIVDIIMHASWLANSFHAGIMLDLFDPQVAGDMFF
jgi:hypothetical protein